MDNNTTWRFETLTKFAQVLFSFCLTHNSDLAKVSLDEVRGCGAEAGHLGAYHRAGGRVSSGLLVFGGVGWEVKPLAGMELAGFTGLVGAMIWMFHLVSFLSTLLFLLYYVLDAVLSL